MRVSSRLRGTSDEKPIRAENIRSLPGNAPIGLSHHAEDGMQHKRDQPKKEGQNPPCSGTIGPKCITREKKKELEGKQATTKKRYETK